MRNPSMLLAVAGSICRLAPVRLLKQRWGCPSGGCSSALYL